MSEKKEKILIVEDDIIVARDIEQSLKGFGYRVEGIISSGEEAVIRAQSQRPDLVLMDIRLKGAMDGIAAAEKIREFDIPVVYLTAHSDEETLQRAKLTEPFGYITKPFEERSLYTVVEMSLYKHSMDSRLRSLKEFSENVVESMPVAVAVVDKRGRVTAINRLQEGIFGTRREDALGRVLFEGYVSPFAARAGPLLEKTMKDGLSISEKGLEYMAPGGKEYVLDLYISPFLDKGKTAGAVVAFADSTEKRRLKEKVRVLEKKEIHQLTENDKMVLYGLAKYPELNSIKLSKKLRMKRTTAIGIINKLKTKGFYSSHRLPDLETLGYGMLVVEAGAHPQLSEKLQEACRLAMESRRHVYCICTDKEYLTIAVARDTADYRENVIRSSMRAAFPESGGDRITMEFPLNSAVDMRLFDYGSVLGGWFSIDGGRDDGFVRKPVRAVGRPSKNELKLLYALTRYPDLSDNEIAGKSSLSKVTVSQIKRRLAKEGLVSTVRMPDLRKLGCGLLLLISLSHKSSSKIRGRDILKHLPAAAIHVEDSMGSFAVIPFRDFSEYRAAYDAFTASPHLMDALIRPPETILLPAGRILCQKLDYSGLF